MAVGEPISHHIMRKIETSTRNHALRAPVDWRISAAQVNMDAAKG